MKPSRGRRCAFWVTRRQYSAPGPCENARDLKPVAWAGKTVPACSPHRAMIAAGHHLTTVAEGQRQKIAETRQPWLQWQPRQRALAGARS